MGGGGGGYVWSKEEAEMWRKTTYDVMTQELIARGIKPPNYATWKWRRRIVQFLPVLLIWGVIVVLACWDDWVPLLSETLRKFH